MKRMTNDIFEDLAARGYAICEGFLASEEVRAWSQWLESVSSQMKPARLGHGSQLRADSVQRGDSTLWLADLPPSAVADSAKALIEDLRVDLSSEMRMGLRWAEAHFARYPAGTGYEKHLDQAPGRGHRRISFVLYLNESWSESDGGELEIFEGDQPLCSISPLGGRLVLFQSERFPHQVHAGKRPRKSLTGWFRDDDLVLGR